MLTGAYQGIGRQVARSFVAEGCTRVALLDRDGDGLWETARLCEAHSQNGAVQALSLPVDVSVEQSVRAAVDSVVKEWGRIDYAVNCAGKHGFLDILLLWRVATSSVTAALR
jgi:NAD(P)-dependent dehydrogenase (short-subunit alcohol dehydrogenase family)